MVHGRGTSKDESGPVTSRALTAKLCEVPRDAVRAFLAGGTRVTPRTEHVGV